MEVWKANRQALKGRKASGDRLPPLPARPPALRKVRLRPGALPSLSVPGPGGKAVTLHSCRRPWEEAARLAGEARPREGEPLVVLGLGLGYHLLALLEHLDPGQPLVVVEPEPEVLYAALATQDLRPLLNRRTATLVVEPDPRQAVGPVRRAVGNGASQSPRIWGHPASLRAAPGYYEELLRRLDPCPRLPRGRPGLRQERLRVLVVNPDYFLVPEVLRAFRRLGHQAEFFTFDKRRDPGEEVVRRLLRRLAADSPDLVFTVNHLGVDREGVLMECLHRLKIPLASWYVDSPALILNLYAGRSSELAYIFTWDPTYIPWVKALGFEHVYPLPLATDPEVFAPRPAGRLRPWACRVSFVGNSLTRPVAEKRARLPGGPDFDRLFDHLAGAYRREPYRDLATVIAQEDLKAPLLADLAPRQRVDLEAGMIWAATRDYRRDCVRQLAPFQPVIYGDGGWRELVGPEFSLRPEVRYYEELPLVYQASQINFNATSLQMKAAVNQRVFDVPAAGGFLLTDFREQLTEVLEVGREVVCYRHPEEIPDLVRFYLAHPEERRRLTQAARQRVLKEHTYVHRLQSMLALMRSTR